MLAIGAKCSIGQIGLAAVVRRILQEGPVSGNVPHFAKLAICALLTFMSANPASTAKVWKVGIEVVYLMSHTGQRVWTRLRLVDNREIIS
jgi:hypothetical protein